MHLSYCSLALSHWCILKYNTIISFATHHYGFVHYSAICGHRTHFAGEYEEQIVSYMVALIFLAHGFTCVIIYVHNQTDRVIEYIMHRFVAAQTWCHLYWMGSHHFRCSQWRKLCQNCISILAYCKGHFETPGFLQVWKSERKYFFLETWTDPGISYLLKEFKRKKCKNPGNTQGIIYVKKILINIHLRNIPLNKFKIRDISHFCLCAGKSSKQSTQFDTEIFQNLEMTFIHWNLIC